MKRFSLTTLALVLLSGTAVANSNHMEAWSLSPQGIYIYPVRGDFVRPSPAEGEGPSTRLTSATFEDAFDHPWGVGVTLDFWESGARSFFVEVSRISASGKTVPIGMGRNANLAVRPTTYESTNLLLGFRFQLNDEGLFRPYYSLRAGAAFFDAINYDLFVNGQPAGRTQALRSSTSFQGGAGFGILLLPGNNFHLGIEAGLEITSPLRDGGGMGFENYGIGSFNRDKGLTALPVRLFGGIRF